ncbi:MAG: tripartite tricarboxylate transporter substrate binding protein [Pseudomonadota bacterium]
MKSPISRASLALALFAAAGATLAADPYPSKPIRFVVNSAAGALMDVTARAVAQQMSEKLGQPIIVEDKPGADGQLGIRYVKGQPADGYTILVTANTIAQLPAVKSDPGYDLVKDFTGVGIMNIAPLVLVAPASQPEKSLAEFIATAKAKPNALSTASAGVGTSTHMAAALFMHQAGVKMLHVPYKGNAAALPDLVGGRVNMLFDGLNSAGPQIKDGRLKAYGISSPKRSPTYPDIPTLAEQGLPNYSFHVYMGLVAPAGTPKAVVQRLSEALQYAQSTESVRDRFRRDGAQPGTMSPEEFTEFLKQDMQRTVKVATDLGIPKE